MGTPKVIDLTISGTPPTVIHFEDGVLECFFEDGSTRVHLLHIKGIELTDNHGKYLLTVHLRRRDLFIWIEEKQAEPVKELVDQVKQAISASQGQTAY